MRKLLFISTISLASAILISGCAGSRSGANGVSTSGTPVTALVSSRGGTGSLIMSIKWPDRDQAADAPLTRRLIPLVADRIAVTATQQGQPVGDPPTVTISYPTATFAINNVPEGPTHIEATAFSDRSNVPVARGANDINVQSGADNRADFALASTIERIDITSSASWPNPIRSLAIDVHESVTLTATARDSAGSIVLVFPEHLQWTSSDATVAMIDPTRGPTVSMRAVSQGSASITVAETHPNQPPGRNATVSINTSSGSVLIGFDLIGDHPLQDGEIRGIDFTTIAGRGILFTTSYPGVFLETPAEANSANSGHYLAAAAPYYYTGPITMTFTNPTDNVSFNQVLGSGWVATVYDNQGRISETLTGDADTVAQIVHSQRDIKKVTVKGGGTNIFLGIDDVRFNL